MRYLLVFLTGLLLATVAQAFDTTTQGLVISAYVTSQITTVPFDQKLILDARDDAAAFVATQGKDRGVRLEAALAALRRKAPASTASDLELAQAILIQ